MPDDVGSKDFGSAWRDQPEEKRPVELEQFANRRSGELYSSTRSEILSSIGAALFFVALIAWRFASVHDRLPRFGWVALIAVIGWTLISLYWFRDRIWRPSAPPRDALAATGLEYYRNELERRFDHLRNEWLWHGPLFLACMLFVAIVIGKAFPGFDRLRNALPLFALLAVWTGLSITRRRRQANELRQELAQVNLPPRPEPNESDEPKGPDRPDGKS